MCGALLSAADLACCGLARHDGGLVRVIGRCADLRPTIETGDRDGTGVRGRGASGCWRTPALSLSPGRYAGPSVRQERGVPSADPVARRGSAAITTQPRAATVAAARSGSSPPPTPSAARPTTARASTRQTPTAAWDCRTCATASAPSTATSRSPPRSATAPTVSGSIPLSPDQASDAYVGGGYRTSGMGSTRALDHYILPAAPQSSRCSRGAVQTGPRCRVRAAARRS